MVGPAFTGSGCPFCSCNCFNSEILARGLSLPDSEVKRVVQAGVMHDVGKIGVRYDMLNKPGKLTAVFRQHPEKGKRILAPVP